MNNTQVRWFSILLLIMVLNRETKESNTFYVSETQLQAGTVRQQFQVQLLW